MLKQWAVGSFFLRKYSRRANRSPQKFTFFIKTSKWEKWWSWWLRMTNAFILHNLLWKVQKSLAANREGSCKVCYHDVTYWQDLMQLYGLVLRIAHGKNGLGQLAVHKNILWCGVTELRLKVVLLKTNMALRRWVLAFTQNYPLNLTSFFLKKNFRIRWILLKRDYGWVYVG